VNVKKRAVKPVIQGKKKEEEDLGFGWSNV
jgi:hypothetical protein